MTADAATTSDRNARTGQVVVGVDGSDTSIEALRWAGRIAATFSTGIDAIACWEYPATYGVVPIETDWGLSANAQKVLDEAVIAAYGDTPPAGLQTEVLEGHPVKMLLQATEGALMLVVGSRGHGGFMGMLLGSVSAPCAELATCPVLVVRTSPAA